MAASGLPQDCCLRPKRDGAGERAAHPVLTQTLNPTLQTCHPGSLRFSDSKPSVHLERCTVHVTVTVTM